MAKVQFEKQRGDEFHFRLVATGQNHLVVSHRRGKGRGEDGTFAEFDHFMAHGITLDEVINLRNVLNKHLGEMTEAQAFAEAAHMAEDSETAGRASAVIADLGGRRQDHRAEGGSDITFGLHGVAKEELEDVTSG